MPAANITSVGFIESKIASEIKVNSQAIVTKSMQELSFQLITTDSVYLPECAERNISIKILRLDKLHPLVSGNKFFKLRFYLEEAQHQGKKTIITFGGPFSNHIIATAAACNMNGFKSIGIIRGERPKNFSHTLQQASFLGMELVFISREEYRRKIVPEELLTHDCYVVNEGGSGHIGAMGAATIAQYFLSSTFTHICCAVGTGTMMAGLMNACPDSSIIGVSVLKNNLEIDEAIRLLLEDKNRMFSTIHDYHFGGYAKYQPRLIDFMNQFFQETGIPSDFVYTGKLLYAVMDLIKKNYFPSGSRLLVIHSGGLQGNLSLAKGTLIF